MAFSLCLSVACGKNGIVIYLHLGIFPHPVGEGGRGHAVFLLDLGVGFAGLVQGNDGFLELFCVLGRIVFCGHMEAPFCFFSCLLFYHACPLF